MNNSFLSHSDAAQRNRNVVLRYIRDNAPVSRTDIWENLEMSRASVTQIIKQFQDSGWIENGFEGVSSGGRKPLYIHFDGKNIAFFAFDWTAKALYFMNLNGEVLCEMPQELDGGITPLEFSQKLKTAIDDMSKRHGVRKNEVAGFVLGLPGIINPIEKKLILSVELGWENIDLAELFEDRFGENVYIERTLNLIALAETALRMKNNKVSHLQVFIFDASGIGVSTVIHGNMQHGLRCMHGELGHIKLFSDEVCSCGQKGCLEAIIKKLMRESGGKLSDEILEYISIGISTAVNICDTDVVLTGSYIEGLHEAQKKYLENAILSKISGPNTRTFEIHYLHDVKRMGQFGLCTYMFDCCFPT